MPMMAHARSLYDGAGHADDGVERDHRTMPDTRDQTDQKRSFLTGSFPFPKSLYAVEDALRFFVAGQATTP